MTHTVFPGVAIAFVAGQSLFLGALAFGLLSAVLLTGATRIPRVDPDAALGVLLGAFFSIGVIVVSTTHGYTADLTALLFGRILNVDTREIVDTVLIAVVVLGVLAALHKELVFRAFDPTGSEALGYRAVVLDLVLNALVALVVVAAVRAVGTVLVIALIVVPAATARLVTDRVRSMIVVSVGVSALCGYLGLAASYEASLHHGVRLGSGATIVIALTIAFVAVGGTATVHRRRRRPEHQDGSAAVVA
jgi:manganese/iron transport system permease protein